MSLGLTAELACEWREFNSIGMSRGLERVCVDINFMGSDREAGVGISREYRDAHIYTYMSCWLLRYILGSYFFLRLFGFGCF